MTKQDIVSKIAEIPEDTLMKQLSELFEYINSWDTWTKLKQADPDRVAVVYSISEDFYKTEEINSRIINNISGASFIPKEVGVFI